MEIITGLQEQLADGSWTPMITGRVSIIDELGSISFEGTQTILETAELGSYCNTRAHVPLTCIAGYQNNDADGRFRIDGNGRIYLSGIIDYEVKDLHEITIVAIGRAGENKTALGNYICFGRHEPPEPLADADATANFVLENSAVGSPVGITAFAHDPERRDVSYSFRR